MTDFIPDIDYALFLPALRKGLQMTIHMFTMFD